MQYENLKDDVHFLAICLDSRLEIFKKQIQKYNLNHVEIIPAVIFLSNTNDYVQHVDTSNKNSLCTLSHILVMESIIKSNKKYGVVFEDDVALHKNFTSVLSTLIQSKKVDEFQIISLGYLFDKSSLLKTLCDEIQLSDTTFSIGLNNYHAWGSQCYICTKEYCIKTLNNLNGKIKCTEDLILQQSSFYVKTLNPGFPKTRTIIFPPLAIERFDVFGSTLGHKSYNKKSFDNIDIRLLTYYDSVI